MLRDAVGMHAEPLMKVVSPLTQTAEVTLLETISVCELAQRWKQELAINVEAEFRNLESIYLYRCETTGLLFFKPDEITGTARLYEQLQRYESYYMPLRWEHEVALPRLGAAERVLEVGCGTGGFVKAARTAGLDIQGIELNEAAIRQAAAENLPVQRMNLVELKQAAGAPFDTICLFQVLEHLPEPARFLTEALEVLKPRGRMIISVPNAESFLKQANVLLDLPPHHMLRWSPAAFRGLEKLFPLRCEQIICESLANYHIGSYLDAFRNRHAGRFRRRIFTNWAVLGFYEIMLRAGFRRFVRGQSLYVELRACR